MSRVVIVDYGLGNLKSIENACLKVGLDADISSSAESIRDASAIILPGVGSFPVAMNNLKEMGLINAILDHVKSNKLTWGICLGFQLLFEYSLEFNKTEGLNILPGQVDRFPDSKVEVLPHVGWNRIILSNLESESVTKQWIREFDNCFFYFVHSYHPYNVRANFLGYTSYENQLFPSIVIHNNIIGTQFHPEKSGENGLKLLRQVFAHMT